MTVHSEGSVDSTVLQVGEEIPDVAGLERYRASPFGRWASVDFNHITSSRWLGEAGE
jgi:hypothetical protein